MSADDHAGTTADDPLQEPSIGELMAAVEVLVGQLELLNERVTTLEDDGPAATMPFEEWVPWMLGVFIPDSQLSQWADVPAVALELHALHAAWCDAHKGDGSPRAGTRAATWHETLDRARPRMLDYMGDHRRRAGLDRMR